MTTENAAGIPRDVAEMLVGRYRDAVRAIPRSIPPELLRPSTPKDYKMADTLCADVETFVRNLEQKLEPNQQLLALFFDRVGRPIRVTDFGYHNPTMMVVWGVDPDGDDCCVLVHMSSFELFVQVVEEKPEAPRRPIGFVAPPPEPSKG